MYIEKPEMKSGGEGEVMDDFTFPPFLEDFNLKGLNHAEVAAVRREFTTIAENARAKRGRFSAQFADKDGWEETFKVSKDGRIESDPGSSDFS